MQSLNASRGTAKTIEMSSPLYDYWRSSQSDTMEEERLQKASKSFPATGLFKKEPYKWEILFQSIIRELREGDKDSIKGLRLLINMLNREEQVKTIKAFSDKNILSDGFIKQLTQQEEDSSSTKKNMARFIRILFAIFTNPYCIEIKRNKSHIYEQTGAICYSFRNLL